MQYTPRGYRHVPFADISPRSAKFGARVDRAPLGQYGGVRRRQALIALLSHGRTTVAVDVLTWGRPGRAGRWPYGPPGALGRWGSYPGVALRAARAGAKPFGYTLASKPSSRWGCRAREAYRLPGVIGFVVLTRWRRVLAVYKAPTVQTHLGRTRAAGDASAAAGWQEADPPSPGRRLASATPDRRIHYAPLMRGPRRRGRRVSGAGSSPGTAPLRAGSWSHLFSNVVLLRRSPDAGQSGPAVLFSPVTLPFLGQLAAVLVSSYSTA